MHPESMPTTPRNTKSEQRNCKHGDNADVASNGKQENLHMIRTPSQCHQSESEEHHPDSTHPRHLPSVSGRSPPFQHSSRPTHLCDNGNCMDNLGSLCAFARKENRPRESDRETLEDCVEIGRVVFEGYSGPCLLKNVQRQRIYTSSISSNVQNPSLLLEMQL